MVLIVIVLNMSHARSCGFSVARVTHSTFLFYRNVYLLIKYSTETLLKCLRIIEAYKLFYHSVVNF